MGKNHLRQNFRKCHYSMMHPTTKSCNGHCGLHSPGIGWVVKGLEQPVAWLCSRVDGWIPFLTQSRQKQKRKFPEQMRNKRGNSRNGVQCRFWFWSALPRAICWHWHVAFIPQELYISHVSVDLGCLALFLQIWWQCEWKPSWAETLSEQNRFTPLETLKVP